MLEIKSSPIIPTVDQKYALTVFTLKVTFFKKCQKVAKHFSYLKQANFSPKSIWKLTKLVTLTSWAWACASKHSLCVKGRRSRYQKWNDKWSKNYLRARSVREMGGECELHNLIFFDRDELTIFAVWAKCFERETKIIQIWAKFCHFGKNCQSIYQF